MLVESTGNRIRSTVKVESTRTVSLVSDPTDLNGGISIRDKTGFVYSV